MKITPIFKKQCTAEELLIAIHNLANTLRILDGEYEITINKIDHQEYLTEETPRERAVNFGNRIKSVDSNLLENETSLKVDQLMSTVYNFEPYY